MVLLLTGFRAVVFWAVIGSIVLLFMYAALKCFRVHRAGVQLTRKVNIKGSMRMYLIYGGSFPPPPLGHVFQVDGKDLKANFLPKVNTETVIPKLTPDSMVPSSGYRLEVEKTQIKRDDTDFLTLQVFFKPAQCDYVTWTLVEETADYLLFKHPFMGELHFPKGVFYPLIGGTITLVSEVEKVADNLWRLTYRFP